jgi:hypothetical protein
MSRTHHYYLQRARAAYIAAEAATDPRDKAAYRGAARIWEQLAKPATQATFTLAPQCLQLKALKRDMAEAIDTAASAPIPHPLSQWREAPKSVAGARQTTPESVTIEF